MSLLCLLFGHSHGCQCTRCGKERDEHHWDGCHCTRCNQVNHSWIVKDWSTDGYNYTFEKECIKCKEKTKVIERVDFDKIVFGKSIIFT
jgi:hypothetical protein